ncbi:MAG: GGDEF domain-containing protein [Isosphaeraceae bacterium]|nr:GGDEF domain-containing protein [Isosphaeraceae bacterium]
MEEKSCATHFCLTVAQESAESFPAPTSPSPLYLIMLNGGIPGAMLQVSKQETRLGRASDNTLQLADSSISRYHALLETDDEGQVRLSDLESTNGTFVNGKRLPPHTPVPLKDGDRLQFGAEIVVKLVRPDPCEERFQREMFERTVRDSLTGLYNRAYFLSQVGPLADRNAVKGMGLAVIMLDVDHFKRVNDQYGHPIGDAVLREVANVLRQSLRGDDLIARYGGEEFVAALPVATPDQAAERAERIRASLADRRIHVAGTRLRVTASLGLAFGSPTRPKTAAALISSADQGLYQAKNAGRNRVVFGPEVRLRPRDIQTAVPQEF